MLETIEYINKFGLDSLNEKLSINIKRHKTFNNLVLLKYSQINSPTSHPVVRECRGLILDESDNWKVVSYPYKRFSNYGESWADTIDWNSSRIYEKLDGSLMTLYYYGNKWNVASSGSPDASGDVFGFDFTFADLFWKTWNKLGYSLPNEKHVCYMFELMSPFNRVVVKHEEDKLILHGARNLNTLKELNPIVESHLNKWQCVQTYDFKDVDDALLNCNSLNPLDHEGFVVCDTNYNRVKIKSAQYVALSHLKESVASSPRQLLEIIRTNEGSEFLQYFEHLTTQYYNLKSKYDFMVGMIDGFYDAVKDIEDRKLFAIKVKDKFFSAALFQMKNTNSSSSKQFISNMQIKSLEGWLKLNE